MGSSNGPVASIGSLTSAGLSAVSEYEQGRGTAAADNAQAARLQIAAEAGRAAAAETDAQMRDRLNITLGNIDAVRAASGADPSSPTTAALRQRTEFLGDQQRGIEVGNIDAQVSQDVADANYAQQAGSFAQKMAAFGAASSVLGAIGKTNWSTFGVGAGDAPGAFNITQLAAPSQLGTGNFVGPLGYNPMGE